MLRARRRLSGAASVEALRRGHTFEASSIPVRRIIELATAAKLPAVFQWPESAEDGGLLGYGPSFTASYAQLAGFVARILEGAKAGDLPMEQALPRRDDRIGNTRVVAVPPMSGVAILPLPSRSRS
jgi:hypothetical protein